MKRQFRRELKRGVYLLPNIFTTANILLGVLAISFAIRGKVVLASWAIVAAGFFDAFDGRIARLTNSESEFGVEYDSLADAMSFGIAPAVMMYCWTLQAFPKFGWLSMFIYVCCAALRLARYNVQTDSGERTYFYGLPTPAGAGMIASTILFYHYLLPGSTAPRLWWANLLLVGLGLLMITTVRYRSFKQLNLRTKRSFFHLVLTVGIVALLAFEPQVFLFGFGVCYISGGLIEEYLHIRRGRMLLEQEEAQGNAAAAEKIHDLTHGDNA